MLELSYIKNWTSDLVQVYAEKSSSELGSGFLRVRAKPITSLELTNNVFYRKRSLSPFCQATV